MPPKQDYQEKRLPASCLPGEPVVPANRGFPFLRSLLFPFLGPAGPVHRASRTELAVLLNQPEEVLSVTRLRFLLCDLPTCSSSLFSSYAVSYNCSFRLSSQSRPFAFLQTVARFILERGLRVSVNLLLSAFPGLYFTPSTRSPGRQD